MAKRKDIIRMSITELKRLPIIHKVIKRELTQAEASSILEICTRQIRRIRDKVKKEGDESIAHRSRGRPSHNAKPGKIKNRALYLCRTRYKGFNPTFASEKLFEIDKIAISDETLRLWFIENNIEYKTRRARKHRKWRERKRHFGEMVQVDGSHHNWFESRGPKCVFMLHVDDATSKRFGRFYEYEGTLPFMDSFKRYVKKYGLPHSVYIDKHSTYKSTGKPSIEDELNNREPLTQVGRALEELGVDVIFADSPQAKGRVERNFETFQDRLIKEMRLRKIKNIAQANAFLGHYLPGFDKRFSVEPIEDANLHRPLPKGIDLDVILCIKKDHPLRNDFTVVHDKRLYQILERTNAKKVTVEERISGRMLITYKGEALKYKEIAQRPEKKAEKPKYIFTVVKKKRYRPPMEHPLKGPMFRARYGHNQQNSQKEKGAQKEKGLLLTKP